MHRRKYMVGIYIHLQKTLVRIKCLYSKREFAPRLPVEKALGNF